MVTREIVVELLEEGSEELEERRPLLSLAKEARAPFLDQAVRIEQLLTWSIAYALCPDEDHRRLFYAVIAPTLTFYGKINMFRQILELAYPGLRDESLVKDLHELRKFRNLLAHSELDISHDFLLEGLKDTIRLISYRQGRRQVRDITLDEINQKLAECIPVARAVAHIANEVIGQNVVHMRRGEDAG